MGRSMDLTPLLLGAVAYDPKVITIWDGFQQYFAEHGLLRMNSNGLGDAQILASDSY